MKIQNNNGFAGIIGVLIACVIIGILFAMMLGPRENTNHLAEPETASTLNAVATSTTMTVASPETSISILDHAKSQIHDLEIQQEQKSDEILDMMKSGGASQ